MDFKLIVFFYSRAIILGAPIILPSASILLFFATIQVIMLLAPPLAIQGLQTPDLAIALDEKPCHVVVILCPMVIVIVIIFPFSITFSIILLPPS